MAQARRSLGEDWGKIMKLFNFLLLIVAIELVSQELKAVDSVITFFIKEKKAIKKKHNNPQKKIISESLRQPSFVHAIAKDRSWLEQSGVDGIQASYLGYLTTSNKNGQITFPRLQQSDTIYLLITPQIAPEYMISASLIAHWVTKANQPSAMYEINRKKNKALQTYYFEVKKIPVPRDIKNHNTITIFADPDHIEVPLGISLNTYSTNLILPDLQAFKEDTSKNSLYTLSIKQYFEQINIQNKNNTPTIASMVMNL